MKTKKTSERDNKTIEQTSEGNMKIKPIKTTERPSNEPYGEILLHKVT